MLKRWEVSLSEFQCAMKQRNCPGQSSATTCAVPTTKDGNLVMSICVDISKEWACSIVHNRPVRTLPLASLDNATLNFLFFMAALVRQDWLGANGKKSNHMYMDTHTEGVTTLATRGQIAVHEIYKACHETLARL